MNRLLAHPLRLLFLAVVLLAAFGLGLRWGAYVPIAPADDVRLVTYSSIGGGQDPALTPASAVLLRDGHFAAQTRSAGYLGIVLEKADVEATFTALDVASHRWSAHYPAASGVTNADILRLTMADGTTRVIRIDDPAANLEVPRSLRIFLGTLHRMQFGAIANGKPIGTPALRLVAVPIEPTAAGNIIYDLPSDYDFFDRLTVPGGAQVVLEDDLVKLWHLGDDLLWPGNERVVRTPDKRLYRMAVLVDWEVLLH